eukprot:CAMPEP_0183703834 /NCGR_PEP_ID=MMETSP0737-20130205/1414_1 /TAXON_ID=385413 /ORGANISM="Thalassiosira miniscula, Strain CCMP1093" /LENGTH=679 /DNA_ID=CAMNT_0025930631 /DNA_START=88 /DNA_END=2123 /DNA_ORIENTATION=-
MAVKTSSPSNTKPRRVCKRRSSKQSSDSFTSSITRSNLTNSSHSLSHFADSSDSNGSLDSMDAMAMDLEDAPHEQQQEHRPQRSHQPRRRSTVDVQPRRRSSIENGDTMPRQRRRSSAENLSASLTVTSSNSSLFRGSTSSSGSGNVGGSGSGSVANGGGGARRPSSRGLGGRRNPRFRPPNGGIHHSSSEPLDSHTETPRPSSGYHHHPPNSNSNRSGPASSFAFSRRTSMSDLEQAERRASIKQIMRDGRLSQLEKRRSIQMLMDGRTNNGARRSTIDCGQTNPYLQAKAASEMSALRRRREGLPRSNSLDEGLNYNEEDEEADDDTEDVTRSDSVSFTNENSRRSSMASQTTINATNVGEGGMSGGNDNNVVMMESESTPLSSSEGTPLFASLNSPSPTLPAPFATSTAPWASFNAASATNAMGNTSSSSLGYHHSQDDSVSLRDVYGQDSFASLGYDHQQNSSSSLGRNATHPCQYSSSTNQYSNSTMGHDVTQFCHYSSSSMGHTEPSVTSCSSMGIEAEAAGSDEVVNNDSNNNNKPIEIPNHDPAAAAAIAAAVSRTHSDRLAAKHPYQATTTAVPAIAAQASEVHPYNNASVPAAENGSKAPRRNSTVEYARRAIETAPPCTHYDRNCHIVSPCCGATFGCRICHDDCPVLPPRIDRANQYGFGGEGMDTG